MELLQAKIDTKKQRLTLEIQNTSDKRIRLATYGLGVALECSEFMYSMLPSPHLGYGDWSAAGSKRQPLNPPIEPQQRVTIVAHDEEFLSPFLKPTTFRSCPKQYQKPELLLGDVYFIDGTAWHPQP